MRRDYQATSPLLWVATRFGRFLGDGYREIRALIASNTPHNLKKALHGQHGCTRFSPADCDCDRLPTPSCRGDSSPLSASCSSCMAGLCSGGWPCSPATFCVALCCSSASGSSQRFRLRKSYPLLAKAVAVGLFVVLCLVIPALLSMRPRQEIAAGGGGWASGADQLTKPTLTFADVGGLEEAKKQIRELVQANLNGKKFGQITGCSETASCFMARVEREKRSWRKRLPESSA